MLKLFRKIKYTIMSKIAERKLKKKYGCEMFIKINEFKVQDKDGTVKKIIKAEITSYEKDYKKLIDVLLTKGRK